MAVDLSTVRDYATELGVDPDHAEATAEQESGGNPAAVSKAGAKGVMQVMPGTSKEMAAEVGPDRTKQGVNYLKRMYDQFGGDWSMAHAAYNAGPGRVRHAQARVKMRGGDPSDYAQVEHYLPAETRAYVPGILKRVAGKHTTAAMDPAQGEITAGDLGDNFEITPEDLAGPEEATTTPTTTGGPSLGETAKEYVPGLRGLTDLAKLAGHVSGIRPLTEDEWQEMASRGEAQREHPIATALGAAGDVAGVAVPALRGVTALSSAAGAGVEAATGSRTGGHLAQLAAGAAPAVGTLARGAKALGGGERLASEVTRDLGAGTTAKEAGLALQREGAPGAIEQTTDEASRLYGEAQSAAKAGDVKTPPGGGGLQAAAKRLKADAKAGGGSVPGAARRVVGNILKLTRGAEPEPSRILTPSGSPAPTPPREQLAAPVDDLIEQQSYLRRAIRQLPATHPARAPLQDFDSALEDEITKASAGNPEVTATLGRARQRYAQTTIPTRTTAGRVAGAETPEAATKMVTKGVNAPSRLGRIARVEPEVAEQARSAGWNDMLTASTESGDLNLVKLSRKIDAADSAGMLDKLADTPARRTTVKALQAAAKVQKAARKAPLYGTIAGGQSAGWAGIGPGYTLGRIVKAAAESETAARAFYRLVKVKQGGPGWRIAKNALVTAMGKTGAATARAGAKLATEKEEEQ